jgi:hypothetical protein
VTCARVVTSRAEGVPLSLPTSVLPGLAGALVATGVAGTDWWLLPVTLVALLLCPLALGRGRQALRRARAATARC